MALQRLDELLFDLDDCEAKSPALTTLLKRVGEFAGYITANRAMIPNYADRYHYGERIATGFVESTVNQVVSRRFEKKQQVRWTKRGAHLLLQVRTKVLYNEWREAFSGWYPGMTAPDHVLERVA